MVSPFFVLFPLYAIVPIAMTLLGSGRFGAMSRCLQGSWRWPRTFHLTRARGRAASGALWCLDFSPCASDAGVQLVPCGKASVLKHPGSWELAAGKSLNNYRPACLVTCYKICSHQQVALWGQVIPCTEMSAFGNLLASPGLSCPAPALWLCPLP